MAVQKYRPEIEWTFKPTTKLWDHNIFNAQFFPACFSTTVMNQNQSLLAYSVFLCLFRTMELLHWTKTNKKKKNYLNIQIPHPLYSFEFIIANFNSNFYFPCQLFATQNFLKISNFNFLLLKFCHSILSGTGLVTYLRDCNFQQL